MQHLAMRLHLNYSAQVSSKDLLSSVLSKGYHIHFSMTAGIDFESSKVSSQHGNMSCVIGTMTSLAINNLPKRKEKILKATKVSDQKTDIFSL